MVAAGRLEVGQSDGHFPNLATITKYGHFQTPAADDGPVKGPVKGQSEASAGPHPYTKQETVGVGVAAPKLQKSADRAVLDQALADYNHAAATIGFSRCTVLTDPRAKALGKRLAEFGQGDIAKGAERFRDALSAIPHDPFLAGKAKPRHGRKPFRLDFDRLLSIGSGMGDVLAKLVDLFNEHGPAASVSATGSARPTAPSAWAEAQAEELAAQRARFGGFDQGGDDGPVH